MFAHIACGNWQKELQMSDLKDFAITAHGWLDRVPEAAVNPNTLL
jgi:hypothetical protein